MCARRMVVYSSEYAGKFQYIPRFKILYFKLWYIYILSTFTPYPSRVVVVEFETIFFFFGELRGRDGTAWTVLHDGIGTWWEGY